MAFASRSRAGLFRAQPRPQVPALNSLVSYCLTAGLSVDLDRAFRGKRSSITLQPDIPTLAIAWSAPVSGWATGRGPAR